MLRSLLGMVALAAAFALSGCGQEEVSKKQPPVRKAGAQNKPVSQKPASNALAANPSDSKGLAEAKKIFKMQCAQCHGESGRGDGLAAASLNPKPRNYTDKKWQESVSDEEIRKTILVGGVGIGKSPLMPPNPQLNKKPEVLDGLVELIRSFAK